MSYFVLLSFSAFFITNTSVITNLNPLNSVINSLVADSVSLICSSWLKEYKISTLKKLAKPLKACAGFVIFTFFWFKTFSLLSKEALLTLVIRIILVINKNRNMKYDQEI